MRRCPLMSYLSPLLLLLLLLTSLHLLHHIITFNIELLSNPEPTMYYFTSQGIYIDIPRSIGPSDDCISKVKFGIFRERIPEHVAKMCSQVPSSKNDFNALSDSSLNCMVIDKRRNFFYTGIVGAFGAKWSKLMVEMAKVDGGSGNLVRLSELRKSDKNFAKLSESFEDLFRFYFVRNPLDRVISGYFYYFSDLEYAARYLDGKPLQELIQINKLDERNISEITFEQYIRWIIYGQYPSKHFGVQYDLVEPCKIDYTLHGIFEIMALERTFISDNVLSLKTDPVEFTTRRANQVLRDEALELTGGVPPDLMARFYGKYRADFVTWDYSKPGDWWYPYPGVIRFLRVPRPPGYVPVLPGRFAVNPMNGDWKRMLEELEEAE